jgi:hypothetical protein
VSLVRDCQNEGDGVDSNIIRVSGIKGVARETLQYYFGNKSASGGGKISSIQGDINDEDVIYIQFTDRQGRHFCNYKIAGANQDLFSYYHSKNKIPMHERTISYVV